MPQNSKRTTRNSSKSKERNSRKKNGKSVKKIVNDDSRVETGNDNDDNNSVDEIRDKENSVREKGVDRVETENDDDDKKSVDDMRDRKYQR